MTDASEDTEDRAADASPTPTEEVAVAPRPPWWRRGSAWAQLVSCLALTAVLAAVYFPGSLVPDTIDMCNQAFQGVYNDWHSPILAGAWGFVGIGAAWLWLGQTVLFVAAIGLLLRRWLRPAVSIVATWVVVCFPATVAWVGHLGKDNWFAVAMLWLIVCAAAGWRTTGRARLAWAASSVAWAWLAVAARPNGIVPVAAVLLVALPMPAWSRWRPPVRLVARAAVAGAVVVAVFVSTTVWERVVVDPRPSYPQQVTYGFDLAGLSEASGRLLLPDVAFTRRTDLAEVSAYFDPRSGAGYYYGAGTPVAFGTRAYDAEEIAQLQAAWRDAVTEYPLAWLRLRATYAAALLGWSGPPPWASVVDTGSDPDDWGDRCPVPDRWNPGLNESVTDGLRTLERGHIWRGWTFLLVLVVAAAVAGLRRSVEARALLAAGTVSIASVALAGGTTTFRYSWFTAICALVAVALALSRVPVLARDRGGDPTGDASGDPAADAVVDDAVEPDDEDEPEAREHPEGSVPPAGADHGPA